jgi:uncharacterized delta-60 repeat protein
MSLPLRFYSSLTLVALLPLASLAQTLDPAFAPPAIYAPAAVYSTLEQPDGKLLVTGNFTRIDGLPSASGVARFSPTGTLDAAFQQNLGTTASVWRVERLSNGQLLLLSSRNFLNPPLLAGGLTRQGLLRLNADGTADASFDIGAGPSYTMPQSNSYLDDVEQLPNGQLLAVGLFDQFSGAAAGSIVRLNADGTVDPTLAAGLGADNEIATVLALPGGKFLIGGFFSSYNGQASNGLARLNADGSFDPTFVAPALGIGTVVGSLTRQPDGKILVGGDLATASGGKDLLRLLPDGALDPNFTPTSDLDAPGLVLDAFFGKVVELQPDGKILVTLGVNSLNAGTVVRLNADGSRDATFQVGSGPNTGANSLTLLSNGKLLISGQFSSFNGLKDRTLVQLSSTGALDASFQPVLQQPGTVTSLLRQADGKLVAGGTFSEINGQVVRRLARFNPDGTLDNAFSASTGGLDWNVADLAEQPDGRLVVASSYALLRFQANGQPDPSLDGAALGLTAAYQVAAQPDGKLLVAGGFRGASTQSVTTIKRLNPNGTLDNSFNLSGVNISFANELQLQPDGKVLLLGHFNNPSRRGVNRFNANGTLDTGFTMTNLSVSATATANPTANALALQPDGKILVGGTFGAAGGTVRNHLARLNADGTPDTGFVPADLSGVVTSLAVQPNGRILIGGQFTSSAGLPANLARVLPSGAADASFAATAVPNSRVRTLLVQPDGGLVLGGSFTALSGQSSQALARLNASNVLHAALPQAVADRTQAWPVPARSTLHVALDPAARAQTLELLDVLGRPVRRQALLGAAAATLAVDDLPAGTYLLRVNYAAGTVLRRVQVQ